MRTFSIHTSPSHACTPSTAVKIHPGNSQPPIKQHINPRNIPRLLHLNLSINAAYTDHNPQLTEHSQSTASYFVIHLFFLIIIPFSKVTAASLLRPQTNKYYNCTYWPCVEHGFLFLFKLLFLFWREREKERKKEYGG